jgi:hypothetical protein
MTVNRREKGKNTSTEIAAPRAQQDYVKYFNAVDRNDHDSADYSTSICTNHYYLLIFGWILDRVIHAMMLWCIIWQTLGFERMNGDDT